MARFSVVTFGCQMNQHDSDRMSEVLTGAGYFPSNGVEDADLIVLNTCSVREKAEHKLRSEVGRLALLKRERPHLVLAVAGCVAQQEGDRLLRSMPAVDLILGPDHIAELPQLLSEIEHGAPPRVRTVFDVESPRFLTATAAPGTVSPSAFVTIMKGCNERCTYCIVPTTRGPERYRPSHEIIDEIARLTDAGVKEVTLLGQTVNSYRDPARDLPAPSGDPDETEFPELLRRIAARVPGLARLRYTSPHPRHLTPALSRAHAELPVLMRHVHMPVQSGSDRLLKRMIRRYTAAEYVERMELLRSHVPGLAVSTDIIVGFPGETEEDFARTLELVERVGFVGVFGFKYSERPFTPALKLGDDVPEEEKSRRLESLFRVSEAQKLAHLERLVGSRQRVLVEGRGKGDTFTGRNEHNDIVHLGSATDPTGEIVEVTVLRAFKNSLEGELTDPARARKLVPKANTAERRALPVVGAG